MLKMRTFFGEKSLKSGFVSRKAGFLEQSNAMKSLVSKLLSRKSGFSRKSGSRKSGFDCIIIACF